MSEQPQKANPRRTSPPQLRSLMAQYGQYRARIKELIQNGTKKPIARVSLALVGTLTFVAMLSIFALRPTLVTISKLVKDIHDEEQIAQALDAKIRALQTAQGELSKLKDRIPLLSQAIPKTNNIDRLAHDIEALARRHGLTMMEWHQSGFAMKSSSPSAQPKNRITSTSLTFSVGGTEASVRSFITDLERLDRLLVLPTVSVESVDQEDRDAQPFPVRAGATLELFYQQ